GQGRSSISTFQMLMPSERSGPVAASRVVSVSLATLITECESSDSWIRTAPYTEWVRSCLKGLTTVPDRDGIRVGGGVGGVAHLLCPHAASERGAQWGLKRPALALEFGEFRR